MKRVSILVMNQAIISAIGNSRHLFANVNKWIEQAGAQPVFEVKLVGLTPKVYLDDGMFLINVDEVLEEIHETDLVIIPPMTGKMETAIEENIEYIHWIKKQHRKGAEVASLCVGAFILAETGLLDGEECSTHWDTRYKFRERFPNVKLIDYKVITDNNGLYTSGGANSYWNLLIYLVQKFTCEEVALHAAKYFEIDVARDNQLPFIIFEGYKRHSDETILKSQIYLEENYTKKLTTKFLSKKYAMSTRTFHRRFRQATQETVHNYLQKLRVESAKKLLESSSMQINEVMYEVGYHDPKTFRKIFKRNTGMTPIAYRMKFKIYEKLGSGVF